MFFQQFVGIVSPSTQFSRKCVDLLDKKLLPLLSAYITVLGTGLEAPVIPEERALLRFD